VTSNRDQRGGAAAFADAVDQCATPLRCVAFLGPEVVGFEVRLVALWALERVRQLGAVMPATHRTDAIDPEAAIANAARHASALLKTGLNPDVDVPAELRGEVGAIADAVIAALKTQPPGSTGTK
jgi:hypothetical protein